MPKSISEYKILHLLMMNNKHIKSYLPVHLYVGIYTDIQAFTNSCRELCLFPIVVSLWMFIISSSSNENGKNTVGRRYSFWKGSHVNPSRTS